MISTQTGSGVNGSNGAQYEFIINFILYPMITDQYSYCSLGYLDNGEEDQRTIGKTDVYYPNMWQCPSHESSPAFVLDGISELYPYISIKNMDQNGWRPTELKIQLNNMVEATYAGGDNITFAINRLGVQGWLPFKSVQKPAYSTSTKLKISVSLLESLCETHLTIRNTFNRQVVTADFWKNTISPYSF
ncbi:uncharacterized protein LOC142348513 [Convolutriloba macropyga]|uniref:uncharacterized protein LOC142348513 n=1 Tax=Convolutriloba macropyga TaxID=536237 RepID=UPI003F522EB0